MKGIHFPINPGDDEQTLIDSVRRYSTNNLLKNIHRLSLDLLMDSDTSHPGTKFVTFYLQNDNYKRIKESVWVLGWNLVTLAYRAILHSNDYRGNDISEIQELYVLLRILMTYDQSQEKKLIDELKERTDSQNEVQLYVRGFSGEQFKYQLSFNDFDVATRELYLLFECQPNEVKIDIPSIILKETGVDWKTFLCCLLLEFSNSLITPFVNSVHILSQIHWNEQLSFSVFESIIKRYTANYNEIRKDVEELGRQQLYTKPFIKTQKKELISISPFLNHFLYEHSILWVVRDYYRKQNKQDFTNAFGYYFEEYAKRLFNYYDIPAKHIPEDKKKRADWIVELCGFTFLIEQKSALISLSVKQPETDRYKLFEFIKRNLFEAFKQLIETEKEYPDRECIKIVLTYEDYLIEWNNDTLFALSDSPVKEDDGLFWHLNINELEILLQLYKADSNHFIALVNEKIKNGKEHSSSGRNATYLLEKYGVTHNKYIHNGIIDKYHLSVVDMLEKYTQDTSESSAE